MNNYLIIISITLLVLSFFKDREKTIKGLKICGKKLLKISIPLIKVLIMVSIVLFIIPDSTISTYLVNKNNLINITVATLIGSITMMPGFIAFPLAGILKQNDVPYMIISAFTTTLMMVGILTFPIERKYFGTKAALLRNLISLLIAVIVSVITGIFFGEVF